MSLDNVILWLTSVMPGLLIKRTFASFASVANAVATETLTFLREAADSVMNVAVENQLFFSLGDCLAFHVRCADVAFGRFNTFDLYLGIAYDSISFH